MRISKDNAGLEKLQTELNTQVDAELAAQSFALPEQLKQDYKTIGGVAFLDNEYTVFGEVIENLEVIDKIANAPTLPGDRPTSDIKMTISIIEQAK